MESVQHYDALAITGDVRGTSKEKLYQELDFEYLQSKRWFRKLSCFYKIIKNKAPLYLFNLIRKPSTLYSTRQYSNVTSIKVNHNFFKSSYLPTVIEWNNLDPNIRASTRNFKRGY